VDFFVFGSGRFVNVLFQLALSLSADTCFFRPHFRLVSFPLLSPPPPPTVKAVLLSAQDKKEVFPALRASLF